LRGAACNKDFSCVNGFCPSFVTVEGGTPKKAATAALDLPDLPEPELPAIHGTHNVVITGVGGTGVANTPEDISAIRVATGEAHALIGGDLVVSAGASTLGLTRAGQTGAVVNSHEIITGDFTRDTEFKLPTEQLRLSLEARLRRMAARADPAEP